MEEDLGLPRVSAKRELEDPFGDFSSDAGCESKSNTTLTLEKSSSRAFMRLSYDAVRTDLMYLSLRARAKWPPGQQYLPQSSFKYSCPIIMQVFQCFRPLLSRLTFLNSKSYIDQNTQKRDAFYSAVITSSLVSTRWGSESIIQSDSFCEILSIHFFCSLLVLPLRVSAVEGVRGISRTPIYNTSVG